MAKPSSKNESMTTYLMGVLGHVRQVEEKLTTVDPVPQKPKGEKSQIRNETITTFEFGIPESTKVTDFRVKIHYRVILSFVEGAIELCKYESTSVAFFELQSKGGFDNWDNVPNEVMIPYFAVAHYLARQRAEERLLAAGFRGIALPVPDNLKGPSPADVELVPLVPKRPRSAPRKETVDLKATPRGQ